MKIEKFFLYHEIMNVNKEMETKIPSQSLSPYEKNKHDFEKSQEILELLISETLKEKKWTLALRAQEVLIKLRRAQEKALDEKYQKFSKIHYADKILQHIEDFFSSGDKKFLYTQYGKSINH